MSTDEKEESKFVFKGRYGAPSTQVAMELAHEEVHDFVKRILQMESKKEKKLNE